MLDDIIDLVETADAIGVTVDRIAVPVLKFDALAKQIEDAPEEQRSKLIGLQLVRDFPVTRKYAANAEQIEKYYKFLSFVHPSWSSKSIRTWVFDYFKISLLDYEREKAISDKLVKEWTQDVTGTPE